MTPHDVFLDFQQAKDAEAAAKAEAARLWQAEADARSAAEAGDVRVVATEQATAAANERIKEVLGLSGPIFLVGDDGKPVVESDGTMQIFEPDGSPAGWHVTICKPSNVDVPGLPDLPPVDPEPEPQPEPIPEPEPEPIPEPPIV